MNEVYFDTKKSVVDFVSKNIEFYNTDTDVCGYVDLPSGYRIGAQVLRADFGVRSGRAQIRRIITDRIEQMRMGGRSYQG